MFLRDSLTERLGDILTDRLHLGGAHRLPGPLTALPLTPHAALGTVGHPGQRGLLLSELLVGAPPLLLLLLLVLLEGLQLEGCERLGVGQGNQDGRDLLGLVIAWLYALVREVEREDFLQSRSLLSGREDVFQGRGAERSNPWQEFTWGKFPGISSDNLLL